MACQKSESKSVSQEKMAKHAAIAYALWFVGSWFGLHHLYLDRPRAAFLSFVTLNGWGLAWLHDLLVIPQLVAQANGCDEYKEKRSVDIKYNAQPPLSLLVTLVQIFVGTQTGAIVSSLLPVGAPGIVYEVLFIVGGGYGIKFAGEAIDLNTQGSLKWVLCAMAAVVLPAYAYHGFDYNDQDYRSTKALSVVVGVFVYVMTRRWSSCSSPSPLTVSQSQLPRWKTWSIYWGWLALFAVCGTTALLFHGDVRVEVNGKPTTTPFFEACNNFYQSDAFQEVWSTLEDLYNGKSYHDRFEQRWRKFNVENSDLSGKLRHLKVLGLPRDASERDIKAAYRKLVLQWHPDKYTGEDRASATTKFYAIQEAYEKLVDTNMKPKTAARDEL